MAHMSYNPNSLQDSYRDYRGLIKGETKELRLRPT